MGFTLHIEEKIIEAFVFHPESFNEVETNEIINHINECNYCKDIYEIYQSIYKNINNISDIIPDSNDIDLAEKIVNKFKPESNLKLLTQKSSIIKINDSGDYQIITKPKILSLHGLAYLFKNYPVQSVSYISLAAALFFFVIFFLKKPFADVNPVYLKIKDDILFAYNKTGDILWKKTVDYMPTNNIDSLVNPALGGRRYLILDDIDNDGYNELLITGTHYDIGIYRSDTLYCFNHDGTLRWKSYPENYKYNYAHEWKRTHWVISHFLSAERKHKKTLFLAAHDYYYGTTIISTVNPINGKVTSSLYHSGYINSANHFDIDNDGNEEIFFGGVSSYYKPFLMVIDKDTLMGVMPDFYSAEHKVKGNASYYILFPVTELASALSRTKSIGMSSISKFKDSGIMVMTLEYFDQKNEVALQFILDKNFKIQYISATPPYLYHFEKIKKIKITSPDIINNYLAAYKDSLQYWDGERFVNYPARNKYWDESLQLP